MELSPGQDSVIASATCFNHTLDPDIQTTPLPLAASTVNRDTERHRTTHHLTGDARGSFLTSNMSAATDTSQAAQASPHALSFSFSNASLLSVPEDDLKKNADLILEELHRNQVAASSSKSSLGLLSMDAMSELDEALLEGWDLESTTLKQLEDLDLEGSTVEQDVGELGLEDPSSEAHSQDAGSLGSAGDPSRHDSKDQPIGRSHLQTVVKKRPSERPSDIHSQAPVALFGAAHAGGEGEGGWGMSEMDVSHTTIELDRDELDLLDADFFGLGEQDSFLEDDHLPPLPEADEGKGGRQQQTRTGVLASLAGTEGNSADSRTSAGTTSFQPHSSHSFMLSSTAALSSASVSGQPLTHQEEQTLSKGEDDDGGVGGGTGTPRPSLTGSNQSSEEQREKRNEDLLSSIYFAPSHKSVVESGVDIEDIPWEDSNAQLEDLQDNGPLQDRQPPFPGFSEPPDCFAQFNSSFGSFILGEADSPSSAHSATFSVPSKPAQVKDNEVKDASKDEVQGGADLALWSGLEQEAAWQQEDLQKLGDLGIAEDNFTSGKEFLRDLQEQEQSFQVGAFDASYSSIVSGSQNTVPDLYDPDSDRRISIGTFFAQRTQGLGSLEGSSASTRPDLGMPIHTPPRHYPPVALLSPPDHGEEGEGSHIEEASLQTSGSVLHQSAVQTSKSQQPQEFSSTGWQAFSLDESGLQGSGTQDFHREFHGSAASSLPPPHTSSMKTSSTTAHTQDRRLPSGLEAKNSLNTASSSSKVPANRLPDGSSYRKDIRASNSNVQSWLDSTNKAREEATGVQDTESSNSGRGVASDSSGLEAPASGVSSGESSLLSATAMESFLDKRSGDSMDPLKLAQGLLNLRHDQSRRRRKADQEGRPANPPGEGPGISVGRHVDLAAGDMPPQGGKVISSLGGDVHRPVNKPAGIDQVSKQLSSGDSQNLPAEGSRPGGVNSRDQSLPPYGPGMKDPSPRAHPSRLPVRQGSQLTSGQKSVRFCGTAGSDRSDKPEKQTVQRGEDKGDRKKGGTDTKKTGSSVGEILSGMHNLLSDDSTSGDSGKGQGSAQETREQKLSGNNGKLVPPVSLRMEEGLDGERGEGHNTSASSHGSAEWQSPRLSLAGHHPDHALREGRQRHLQYSHSSELPSPLGKKSESQQARAPVEQVAKQLPGVDLRFSEVKSGEGSQHSQNQGPLKQVPGMEGGYSDTVKDSRQQSAGTTNQPAARQPSVPGMDVQQPKQPPPSTGDGAGQEHVQVSGSRRQLPLAQTSPTKTAATSGYSSGGSPGCLLATVAPLTVTTSTVTSSMASSLVQELRNTVAYPGAREAEPADGQVGRARSSTTPSPLLQPPAGLSTSAPPQSPASSSLSVSGHSVPTPRHSEGGGWGGGEHHVPDGTEYSAASNYLSKDRCLSRDEMDGTDDQRLVDSRGFQFVGQGSEARPGSFHRDDSGDHTAPMTASAVSAALSGAVTSTALTPAPTQPSSVFRMPTGPPPRRVTPGNQGGSSVPANTVSTQRPAINSASGAAPGYAPESMRGLTTGNSSAMVNTSAVVNSSVMVNASATANSTQMLELTCQELSTQSIVAFSHLDLPHSFVQRTPLMQSTPYIPPSNPAALHPGYTITPTSQDGGSMEGVEDALEMPRELKLPQPCCLGISAVASLPLKNVSSRGLECFLAVKDVTLNGFHHDPNQHMPFRVKAKVVLVPRSTEVLQVMFLPKEPAVYEATLQVVYQPILRQGSLRAKPSILTVQLQARGEAPLVQASSRLEFGPLGWGSSQCRTLRLHNHGNVELPLRLTISTRNTWHCFSFESSVGGNVSIVSGASRPESPALETTVLTVHLKKHATEDVCVFCKPPAQNVTRAMTRMPPSVLEAAVEVEVDTPIRSRVLQTTTLSATVGIAKLHIPASLEGIALKCRAGQTAREEFRMLNAGNIDLTVSLAVSDCSDSFSVTPATFTFAPRQEQIVHVNFHPTAGAPPGTKNSQLLMKVEHGVVYELTLAGHVEVPSNASLLADKRFLAFGGVSISRAKEMKVTLLLRNGGPLSVRAELRSTSNAFQLQSGASLMAGNQPSSRDLVIQPRERCPVSVLYCPSDVGVHSGKLVIKPHNEASKYSILLSGYGGVGAVVLEDVVRVGADSYLLDLGRLTRGQALSARVKLVNQGSRAAFVQAQPFTDCSCTQLMPASVIEVRPASLVIPARHHRVMTVVWTGEMERTREDVDAESLSYIAFTFGDEVARMNFRRALRRNQLERLPASAGKPPYTSLNLDTYFEGEDAPSVLQEGEGVELPNPGDLLYGDLSTVSLAVVGQWGDPLLPSTPPALVPRQADTRTPLASTQPRQPAPHAGQDQVTLQCQEPQSLPSSSGSGTALKRSKAGQADTVWSLNPEQLVLSAPLSRGEVSETGNFSIINFSDEELRFTMNCPAPVLTVEPESCVVGPKSVGVVRVKPVFTLATSGSLPWLGHVQVSCCHGNKFLSVQIQCAVTRDSFGASLTGSSMLSLTRETTATSASRLSLPQSAPLPPPLLVSSKELIFPATLAGQDGVLPAVQALTLTNVSSDFLTWTMSSFAPPYVKGMDGSRQVLRVCYSVFKPSRLSGQLRPGQSEALTVGFLPLSSGTFTQHWDITCVAASAQRPCIRVLFSGVGVDPPTRKSSIRSSAGSTAVSSSVLTPSRDSAGGGRGAQDSVDDTAELESEPMVQLVENCMVFTTLAPSKVESVKVQLKNSGEAPVKVEVVAPAPPFHTKHKSFTIGRKHFLKFPVDFRPSKPGSFSGVVIFRCQPGYDLKLQLRGECGTGAQHLQK